MIEERLWGLKYPSTMEWLLVLVITIFLALSSGSAMAVVILASIQDTSAPPLLCPKRTCPAASPNPFQNGQRITIYEIRAGYARMSAYLPKVEMMAKYPAIGSAKLPQKLALWLPLAMVALPPGIELGAKQLNEVAPVKQLKTRIARIPVPVVRPVRETKVNNLRDATMATSTDNPIEVAPENSPIETVETAPISDGGLESDSMPVVPTQTQTVSDNTPIETVALPPVINPEPTETSPPPLPKKLTRELKDKRLKSLPSKPTANLNLQSIITIRMFALELLESKQCNGIAEGGNSANVGFLYVICTGELESFRQFEAPQG